MKISATLLLVTLLAVASLKGANAAGNDEKILIETKSTVSETTEDRTSYQCTFRNLWTKERHPKNFPQELGRWAAPVMWTHTLQFQPWSAGNAVTRGVEKVAEDGFADALIQEFEQQGEQVLDWSEDKDGGFFVSQKDFIHMPPIETKNDVDREREYTFLSVMAGMDPSPDWYTGWYSFWLVDEYSRTYYDHIKIQTYAWDAGTDAGTTYLSLESDLDPPQPIERFVPRNAPEGGELKGPDGDVPVVGEWECFLVVGDEDMIMPECDWFANPCCNETVKENCGATLPNGALPSITPEYAQVLANSGNSNSGNSNSGNSNSGNSNSGNSNSGNSNSGNSNSGNSNIAVLANSGNSNSAAIQHFSWTSLVTIFVAMQLLLA